MANFTPSKKTAQDFNGGQKYINGEGTVTGDALDADMPNNVIESQLWTQALAENPVDNTQANASGEASISIQLMPNGTPQFVVKNIKGETGVSISSVVPDGVDENGGNKYNVLLTNGASGGTIVAPKGAMGDPANIDSLKQVFVEKTGGTITNDIIEEKDGQTYNLRRVLKVPTHTANYIYSVLAICDITNDEARAARYFSGRVYCKRKNGNNPPIDIIMSCEKQYNKNAARVSYVTLSSNTANPVVQFTKNGRTYVGVVWAFDSFPDGLPWIVSGEWSDESVIQKFDYYNNNTKVVLDSDIYSSIQPISSANASINTVLLNGVEPYSPNNPSQKIEKTYTWGLSSNVTTTFNSGGKYNLAQVGVTGIPAYMGGELEIGGLKGLIINSTQFIALTQTMSINAGATGTITYWTIGA